MDHQKEERKELLHDFLNKYDPAHNLSFNGVKFRPGAKRTVGFGIDTVTTQYTKLRIHLAIDSGRSNSTGLKLFCPFDVDRTEFLEDYLTFGTMLFLYTNYGFHVRIAHIELDGFAPGMLDRVRKGKSIKAGELIGDVGNAGLSFGAHAHTEIVSNENEFTILDDILEEKYDRTIVHKNYTEDQVNSYLDGASIPREEGWKMYEEEYTRRRLKIVNDYIGYRTDYFTGKERMFYSSMAVFGM